METSSPSSSSGAPAAVANRPPETVKLFVGGVNESLKEEEISDYFAKFGEVKEVVVVRDKATGNVRGFGFVEFSDPEAAEKALAEKEHVIVERRVEVKRARPRGEQRRNYQSPQYHYQYSTLSDHENNGLRNNSVNNEKKKIFVGGLSSSITEEEFKSYFERFGRITDTVIMYDGNTRRPRGFGFITFDSTEAVDYVLQKKFHELSDKTVEVKVAVPKDNNNHNNFSDSNGGMDGGKSPALSNYQRGYYPPYNPRYGLFPGYAPAPVPGFFYGTAGYGGGYNGIGYGSPFVRSPWNGPGMVGARRSPLPYGNASMYPPYYSMGFGGYTGMTGAGGYRGYFWSGNEKTDAVDHSTGAGTNEIGTEKLEVQQAS